MSGLDAAVLNEALSAVFRYLQKKRDDKQIDEALGGTVLL